MANLKSPLPSLPIGYDQNEAALAVTAGVASGALAGGAWNLTGTIAGALLGGALGWWAVRDRRVRADRFFAERARLRERDLRRNAVHEAGHLIVAWACSSVERVTAARVSAVDGQVSTVFRGGSLWSQLVVKLSGVAAEALVYSRGTARDCKHDLLLALEIAETLAGSEPPWPAPDEPFCNFAHLYATPISATEERVLQYGFQMARRICCIHRPMLEATAALLIERREVTAADLDAALPCRALTIVLGPNQFVGDSTR